MIKVVRENRDVHYLNKDMFIQIKYCEESNILTASPVNAQIPEIKIDGIRSVTDNVEEIEVVVRKSVKENFRDDSIVDVINTLRKNPNHYRPFYLTIEKAIERLKITTVGELLDLGPEKFLEQPGIWRQSRIEVSAVLKDLYGISW